jgi:hypothetical protein
MLGKPREKNMPSNWNKGFTKETHPSVKKISTTMKKRGLDNFYQWREKMKKVGKIPSTNFSLLI